MSELEPLGICYCMCDLNAGPGSYPQSGCIGIDRTQKCGIMCRGSSLKLRWVAFPEWLIIISMAYCKTAVSPLLMHWRYCSLAPNYRIDSTTFIVVVFVISSCIIQTTLECHIEGQALLFILHFLLTWPKLLALSFYIFRGSLAACTNFKSTGQLKA